MLYKCVLQEQINKEIAGAAYVTTGTDVDVLRKLLSEINELGYEFNYLSELVLTQIDSEAEKIVEKYIELFEKEGPRAYLVGKLNINHKDNDQRILRLYEHFRQSDEYISAPNAPAPAHIYTRYDTAFASLKKRRIADALSSIVGCPRDSFYLSNTVKRLSRWGVPALQQLLLSLLASDELTCADFDIGYSDGVTYYPSLETMKTQLKFLAIYGLRYYPSKETVLLLKSYLNDTNRELRTLTIKSLAIIEKHNSTARICKTGDGSKPLKKSK